MSPPSSARRVVTFRARRLLAGLLVIGVWIVALPARGGVGDERHADRSSEEVGPWEPEDLWALSDSGPAPPLTLSKAVGLSLIQWYQRKIATRSVSRCPFAISCSHYAALAVQRHGLLGAACLFIDRNLYRENPGMGARYPLVEQADGTLKLDDRFFITGGH